MNTSKTKQLLLAIFSIFFSFFACVTTTFAATNYVAGDNAMLTKQEVINSDYFAAGRNVVVDGTVNGDAYIAGGNVDVNGTVNGDILAAGGNVNINGHVTGNVRSVGGQITIAGNVGRNATIAGGSISLQNTASVAGSLVSAGGNISVRSPVAKDATFAGGNVVIDSPIGGNVSGQIRQFSLLPQAKILGSVTYWSPQKVSMENGAAILGQTTFHQTQINEQREQQNTANRNFFSGLNIIWALGTLLSAFIIGLLFITFLPTYTEDVVTTITTKPWKSLGLGFLATILLPIVLLLLVISLIGIPFAIVLVMSFLVIIFIYDIFIAITIGQKVLPDHKVWSLLAGLVLFGIVTIIPVLGWIVGTVAFLIGFGALLMTEKNIYAVLRNKKII